MNAGQEAVPWAILECQREPSPARVGSLIESDDRWGVARPGGEPGSGGQGNRRAGRERPKRTAERHTRS